MPDPVINHNVAAPTYKATLLAFVNFLLANGWTHRASGRGDQGGFSVDPAVNLWTGVGDLDENAWIAVQQPTGGAAPFAGTRQLCFQVNGIGANIRLKYSAAIPAPTGFVGGAPSAIQSPTASDQQLYLGSGSDAAPGYVGFLGSAGAAGLYRIQMAMNASSPFGFLLECYPVGGGACTFAFFMDPMVSYIVAPAVGSPGVLAGSFAPEDLDPNLFFFGAGLLAGTLAATGLQGFLGKIIGQPGTWTTLLPEIPPALIGTDSHNGKYPLRSVRYSRLIAAGLPAGPKGESSWYKWKPSNLATADTLTVSTPLDRLVMGDLVHLWDGSVPDL